MPKELPHLPWNLVGVFNFNGFTDIEKEVKEKDLYGKAVLIVEEKIIMTKQRNILSEK